MKKTRTEDKNAFSIRLPQEINKKVIERAEKIGISKSAVILTLLYKEFGEKEQEQAK